MLFLFRNYDVVDIQDVAVVHDVVVQNVVVVQDFVGKLHLATLKSKHPPPHFTTKYLYAGNQSVTSD